MPLVVPDWLGEHVKLPHDANVENISAALVKVGIEEETIHPAAVTGPLVVGKVLAKTAEPQKNGKTINWCLVDVGQEHNTTQIAGVTPDQLVEVGAPPSGARGIVCGAHNFEVGDYVVVSLPGTVLPGPFPIAARKTYGHVSDGMICSTAELGLGDDGSHGIIVLTKPFGTYPAFTPDELTPGQSAIDLLGLGDETLEVNVTPDRGYQFSYRGIAREYGLATGAQFTDPVTELAPRVPSATVNAFAVEVKDAAPIRGIVGCDRFATRIVRGINPQAPTPAWLKKRLEQSGMRSISLPVDITNYVMLDLGQPVHAYDLAKVAAPIVVRRAAAGERLTTLDEVDRKLSPEDLLITDSPDGQPGSRVLGLAGVMGGLSSEITDTTNDVLIECAHFDPVSVARTARLHKLPSEAAKRFERGVDPALPPVAAQMVVDLLVKYAGGTADPAVGDYDHTTAPVPIRLNLGLPSRIVGIPYPPETIIKTLESIGATVTTLPSGEILVTPPTWRPDLTEPVDLVEEIVRIDGYDKVPSVLPAAPGSRGITSEQRTCRSVARSLAEAGLVEVLNYPFVGAQDREAIRQDEPGLTLANPLSADRPELRSNLLITLLDAARRNFQRGLTDFGLYEIGLVTQPALRPISEVDLVPPVGQLPSSDTLAAIHGAIPDQPRQVAAVLVGEIDPSGWWGKGRAADWSDAIGLASRVAMRAGVQLAAGSRDTGAKWHPGRSVQLVASGRPGVVIGVAGELHPKVVTSFSLPARAVAFELDLSALSRVADQAPTVAVPVSAFPLAKEDFAFVVPADVSAGEVQNAIVAGAGELLEGITLFDVYTGDQLGEGRKSLAFNVRQRAADRTLSVDDVKATRERIVAAAREVGAELRA